MIYAYRVVYTLYASLRTPFIACNILSADVRALLKLLREDLTDFNRSTALPSRSAASRYDRFCGNPKRRLYSLNSISSTFWIFSHSPVPTPTVRCVSCSVLIARRKAPAVGGAISRRALLRRAPTDGGASSEPLFERRHRIRPYSDVRT